MCYNMSSNNNMPNSEKLRDLKEDFFASVTPIMQKLGKSEIGRIKALHKFELAYIEFKEKKYKAFIRDAMCVLRDPLTLALAFKRVVQRKVECRKPREYQTR